MLPQPPLNYQEMQTMQGEAPGGDLESKPDAQPLVGKPSVTVSDISHACVLIFLPWILFTLIMLPFALGYAHVPGLAWVMFNIGLLMAIGWMVLKENPGGRPRYLLFLGLLCFFSIVLAMAMGLYCYYRFTYPYHVYEASRWYTDVRPSENPEAKKDAGLITFSTSAIVDFTKGLGFQDSALRTCVAPITGVASDGYVGYWAAGFGDCCRQRGKFTCGPVTDPLAHGGLVLRDVGLHNAHLEQLKMAAKQSGVSYSFTVPDNPIFVKWSLDPDDQRLQFWDSAVNFYVLAICVFLGVCFINGLAVYFGPTRVRTKRGFA